MTLYVKYPTSLAEFKDKQTNKYIKFWLLIFQFYKAKPYWIRDFVLHDSAPHRTVTNGERWPMQ